jgi:hypothetical protein
MREGPISFEMGSRWCEDYIACHLIPIAQHSPNLGYLFLECE